jgi:SAM-dependent methyltransferase
MIHDNFVNIDFSEKNLDRFYIRQSIFDALVLNLNKFDGHLLDIGCGKMPYKDYILKNSMVTEYIGLDIENALEYDKKVKPNFTWNGISMPFKDGLFETAIATEVLEHCPNPQIVLGEVVRVLKPGGCFFFTVPFLWPLHEVPKDEFRYTPFSLKRLLEESGFVNIDIKATGGWHASLGQMLGLWVRRAPMSSKKRTLLSMLLKPVIKYLIKIDTCTASGFNESQMITGLSGVAYKN